MPDALNPVYETIDATNRDRPAATRRQLIAGAGAALGSMGLLGVAESAAAATPRQSADNSVATIVNVAATAEVLATIVNTVGPEKVSLDATTRANIQAAAREELIHYETLTSTAIGATPLTKRIWVPDEVFAGADALLTTLVVGDQIFINAYLLAVTVFARAGRLSGSRLARYAAEFMGAEAVHRALALQSLGRLGNDRAFMRFAQREQTAGLPTTNTPGFYRITDAMTQLESAGFGFGRPGSAAGQFYDFDQVSQRTPDPSRVTTRTLS